MKPHEEKTTTIPSPDTDYTGSWRGQYPPVSPPSGVSAKQVSSSDGVMSHICLLYCWLAALTLGLVVSLWLGTCRLQSLQSQLDNKLSAKACLQIYPYLASLNVANVDPTFLQETDSKQLLTRADILQTLLQQQTSTSATRDPTRAEGNANNRSRDPKQAYRDTNRSSELKQADDDKNYRSRGSRTKRNAEPDESLGDPDQWMWMSSFSRVSSPEQVLSAVEGYCRKAKLYCAAEGQPGPQGNPGEKGSQGEPGAMGPKGDKGAASDPLLVAQNLGNMENMRGPPGPKGDQGEKGAPGERGNMGPPGPNGRPGVPGVDGEKGEPGPQGPPGDRGYNGANGEDGKRGRKGDPGPPGPPGIRGTAGIPGLPGFEGHKGEQGMPGPPGEKGERGIPGICPALCTEKSLATSTITTTPEPTTVTTTTTITTTPTTTTTTPIPTLSPRDKTCSIKMIGKPYFKRDSGLSHGAWMRDASPPSDVSDKLQWNTYGIMGTLLYEFSNEKSMIDNSTTGVYDLGQFAFEGTGHVVFNHSLYYQKAGTWTMVRYDLRQRTAVAENYAHHHETVYYGTEKLYNDLPGAMDFAVDQTGLWVIYANHRDPAGKEDMGYADWANGDVFFLAKLDPTSMTRLKVFKLKVPMNYRGNGFLVCGTLYIIRDSDRQKTSIAWAYDAYTEKESQPRIAFTNPYGKTTQLSYDPKMNQILGWDTGKLIMYPLLLNDQPL